MSQQRKLAAIMFTDIVGYSAMMAKDEAQALGYIQTVRKLLKPLLNKHQGTWIKEIGDGTLSSFSSALNAVNCALDFQKALASESFKARIGLHVGDVTFTEHDVFGDGVNIASRLEPLAPPGGIFISGRVHEDIQSHPEIQSQFVGDRRLKNIARPIKVYALAGEGLPEIPEATNKNELSGFWQGLWQRRLPQVIFLYLLISALITLIVSEIGRKYLLSPAWDDFAWILLLSLLPSVAVIAYYHGRSARDKWVKAEKVTIPLNLVFTGTLLFLLFQGKELGATTQNITVQDEEGQQIQLVQAKSEYRKRLIIFHFANSQGDTSVDWLSAGIPTAIDFDISQDLFVQAIGPFELLEEIKRNNPPDLGKLPVALMRKIARDFRYDYFLTGDYHLEGEDFQISYQLYDTKQGKIVAQQSVSDRDLFPLVDQLTERLKEDLDIPLGSLNAAEDLPVSSVLTTSLSAYEHMIAGFETIRSQNNYQNGIENFRKAVQSDPQFTMAYLNMAVAQFYNNQVDQSRQSMDKVMEFLYALPQREQFAAKSLYYYLEQDQERRIKVLQMWLELYPDDVDAYSTLGIVYQFSGRLEEAEKIYLKAIEVDDNRGNFYVHLAEICQAQNRKEEALEYLQRYAQQYPDHTRSFKLLGDFYLDEGELDLSGENYERATLLDPNNIETRTDHIRIMERRGDFKGARQNYESLLASCKSIQDSLKVVNALKELLFTKGQINEGLTWWDRYLTLLEKVDAPVNVSIQKITYLEPYFRIGEPQRAMEIVKKEEAKLHESLGNLVYFGYMTYYIEENNVEGAENSMRMIREFVKQFGSPANIDLYFEGELLAMKDQHDQAIAQFHAFKPSNLFFPNLILEIRIANSLWKAGRTDQAIKQLGHVLELHPFYPTAHYLMATILIDQDKPNEALSHLEICLQVWDQADVAYKRAQEARNKYRDLKAEI